MERSHERYWEAEIHRLRGHLLLAGLDPLSESEVHLAEECFLRALETARRQGARSLELRAAVSLSRLRRDDGRETEARDLLAPIYTWFSEGLDTPDLREAAALAAELGLPHPPRAHLTTLSGGR